MRAMLIEVGYDRRAAARYAQQWAYARNPRFYDFEDIGGDCTNFVSQCLYAGGGAMNYSPSGWYYNDSDDRAPAWTGVEFLREFLLTNSGAGVYGEQAELYDLAAGDVIFLGADGGFYHSLIVSYVLPPTAPYNIFVCSHTYDRRNARLTDYDYSGALGVHINGARRFV